MMKTVMGLVVVLSATVSFAGGRTFSYDKALLKNGGQIKVPASVKTVSIKAPVSHQMAVLRRLGFGPGTSALMPVPMNGKLNKAGTHKTYKIAVGNTIEATNIRRFPRTVRISAE